MHGPGSGIPVSPLARARTRGGVWEQPPPRLQLTPGEVHAWRAFLDVDPSQASSLLATLAGEEKARARRYHSAIDRHRYVISQGILRDLLGLYLNRPPADIGISRGPFGKPFVGEADAPGGVRFSLSHSGGLALYAFSLERDVGIDFEQPTTIDLEQLTSAGFFSAGEESRLRSLEGQQRQEALLRCWTRKEAYIKATGKGMSASLAEIEVSVVPGAPALLRTPQGEKETGRWSLIDLTPAPGYTACLAVEGGGTVACWEWQGPERRIEARPAGRGATPGPYQGGER
jgi:4'-phosphopantetheinyl transferase